jgi:hypothetical protein
MSKTKIQKNKKNKGQFYTTNNNYILEGIEIPDWVDKITEPFAGKGDLIDWVLQNKGELNLSIQSFDIEPKRDDIEKRDTLTNPPDYKDRWIITNPPYLARNKCENKTLFDMYNTNDLYKCFIKSLVKSGCKGGVIIIPAGFFFSPRDVDSSCRGEFMGKYRILKIKYFEETVFDDTTTTVVVVQFQHSTEPLNEQNVKWVMMPSGEEKTFTMTKANDWIIGGEIYDLPVDKNMKITRHIEGQSLKSGDQQTYMTLNALDSGKMDGRIMLEYKSGYIYPAKDCSRTYATIRISGRVLTEEEQNTVCKRFNQLIEEKRAEYWSLFLPQFRESKEYARKRIPFELAYRIINYIITNL